MTHEGRLLEGVDEAVACRTHLNIVTLADVEPELVEWLWTQRIPRRKVTLIAGDPGAGKSFVTLAVAAAVTLGRPLPGNAEAVEPGDVLLWNGEDGIADTIRPRAERCGADLSRVHVIESTEDATGRKSAFGLASLTLVAEDLERRPAVRLVIIDPLAALLAGVDAHRDTEVRGAIQPLADLAHRSNVAILAVLHLRKSEAARALYRVGGSIGFVGLARSVLLAAKDPESGRRALAPLKSNLGPEAPPIEYRIDDDGFWWGQVAEALSADHLLRTVGPNDQGLERGAAQAILSALESEALTAIDLVGRIKAAGFAERTFERARVRLKREGKIASVRDRDDAGRPTGPWRWTRKGVGNSPTIGEQGEDGDVREGGGVKAQIAYQKHTTP